MSKLGEYFHKKYYPDLDINLVEKHLSNPQVFDTAVSFVHKNHYRDLPIENVRSAFVGEHHDPVLENIYKKYPAFKNMGAVTLKADADFTRDKTGVGDIEYFGNKNNGRQSIIYDNGFEYQHPKPGTHGIVYNPNTNGEQSVMLDMLHGMTDDPIYAKHRSEFKDEFLKTFPGYMPAVFQDDMAMRLPDIKSKFISDGGNENEFNKLSPKQIVDEYTDGYDKFVDNEIDGQIRLLMGGYNLPSYSINERNERLKYKGVADKFGQIENYLKTGVAYTLPETVIRSSQSVQAPPAPME